HTPNGSLPPHPPSSHPAPHPPPAPLPLLFFFHDPAPTEIYTLSLHDALPIYCSTAWWANRREAASWRSICWPPTRSPPMASKHRSEEHTSELQSRGHLVCRLLLEKKKTGKISMTEPMLEAYGHGWYE